LHLAPQLAARNAAGRVADAIRSLFNELEVISAITRASPLRAATGPGDTPTLAPTVEAYWRRVLEYASQGGLQAVLDEYAHFLSGAIGDRDRAFPAAIDKLAGHMVESLTIMTATLTADDVQLDATGHLPSAQKLRFRTRFAVRYGGQGLEDLKGVDRSRSVQRAFNSPFWPFVLCSTSVGQEGLDFHPYCHAVVHWNVPSNPVDLEQREGRVHRYKGHAVRKNVARRHGPAVLAAGDGPDPWTRMFVAAETTDMRDRSGLSPYWLYQVDDPDAARIERHVLALPLSRDAARADALRRSLAVYRMAFGQARQQDVVNFLLQELDEPARKRAAEDLRVHLTPPPSHLRELPGSGAIPVIDHDPVRPDWTPTSLAGPSPTTVQVGLLLDRYVELQSRVRSGRPGLPPALDVDGLLQLLQRFSSLRSETDTDKACAEGRGGANGTRVPAERSTHAPAGDGDMVARLGNLLDVFARARPQPVPRNGAEGYLALLNEFSRIRTSP
jgi:hypothetical protein